MKIRAALLSIALGLWLILTALSFSNECSLILWSDLFCGLILCCLGVLSHSEQRIWPKWSIAVVGAWLQLAPLVFWAPHSWMYLNDTLIGAMALVLSFWIANKEMHTRKEEMPIGWSCSPSSWNYRIPTAGLALLCWFLSRYMAAYQLGYIEQIWDPFFGTGTLDVITSKVSKAFPVSDAGLGAFSYTFEFLLGWQGSTRRFATMPWLVLFYAFLVIPCGAVSILLIILQPVAVGAWCSWCLITAALMLIMIIFTAGEFAASLELMYDAKRKKDSLWQVFWKGERVEPSLVERKDKTDLSCRCGLGITLPWNLSLSILIGIWLMIAPSVLGIKGSLANSNYILGPLVTSISVMSLAEVLRSLRWINLLLGALLLVAPLFASEPHLLGVVNNVVFGIATIGLVRRKGKITQRYGAWEKLIF